MWCLHKYFEIQDDRWKFISFEHRILNNDINKVYAYKVGIFNGHGASYSIYCIFMKLNIENIPSNVLVALEDIEIILKVRIYSFHIDIVHFINRR